MSTLTEKNNTKNSSEKPSIATRIKNRVSKHIKDLTNIFKLPNNEEAWNSFPEETKKEMLESLSMKSIIDLYWINMKDLWEPTFLDRETMKLSDSRVKKDKIWNYVEIDWLKCREWQPGISGFTYEDIRERYYPNQRLKVWFCDKWKFDKYVIINSTWKPKTAEWMPDEIEKKLWWPFYVVDDPKDFQSSKYYNMSWETLYHTHGEKELGISENSGPWINNNWRKEIQMNWIRFVPFEKGASGYVYQEFSSAFWESENCVFLWECKNGKIVWDWVILDAYKKTFVVSSNKDE